VTDPRNVAHDKKVQQEKKHRHEEIAPGATHAVQPGRKPHITAVAEPEAPAADSPDGGAQAPA
jgi:hypothetical protein